MRGWGREGGEGGQRRLSEKIVGPLTAREREKTHGNTKETVGPPTAKQRGEIN